jgi:uncharacterized membrane protein
MRRGLMIAGVILLVIGIALTAWNLYDNYNPTSKTDPGGTILSFTPNGIGPFVSTIRWSGADSSTNFYVSTDQPTCLFPPSGVVASGSGTDGSVSVVLNAGTTYYLVACSGAASVSISVSTVGLGTLTVIGIVLIVIGLILIAIARRRRQNTAPPPVQ